MSLIDAAFWTKIVLRLVMIVVVVVVGGYYGYLLITWANPQQANIFKADLKCGLIPEPVITGIRDIDLTNTTISVEAETSALPIVPKIAYVYKIDVAGQTFTSEPRARQLAQLLGFPDSFSTPSPTQYRFRDAKDLRTLNIDIATLNFDYTLDGNKIPKVPNTNLPSLNTSTSVASGFLSGLGLYNDEFTEGKVFSYPITLSRNGDIDTSTEVRSLQEASLVRIDYQKATIALQYDRRIENPLFARPNPVDFIEYLDKINNPIQPEFLKKFTAPRVSTNPVTGNVQIYIASTEKTGDQKYPVYKATIRNWKTEEFPCGTYPIIQPSDALRAIKEGQGKLVYLNEKNTDRLNMGTLPKIRGLSIFTVQLAYYEPFDRPEFLQPIYIASGEVSFEGGKVGTFGIYIPAIER